MSHSQELANAIKQKIEELQFAQGCGEIKGMVAILIGSNGELRFLQAFDSTQNYAINTGCDFVKGMIMNSIHRNSTETQQKGIGNVQ